MTRLKVIFGGLCRGQDTRGLLFPFGRGWTGVEAEAVVACFEDVASVGLPIKECCGHLGVTKHRCSFGGAQVGGDDYAGAFVKFTQ